MRKILVIPLYFGKWYKKEERYDHITTVKQYVRRSLLFFKSKKDFTIFYPNDPENICGEYIYRLRADQVLVNSVANILDKFEISNNWDGGKEPSKDATDQLASVLSQLPEEVNLIIFIPTNYIDPLMGAVVETGFLKKAKLSWGSPSGIGNTEAFYLDESRDSAIHLRFQNHLDFFIPSNGFFSENVAKFAERVHDKIVEQGYNSFLENVSKLYA